MKLRTIILITALAVCTTVVHAQRIKYVWDPTSKLVIGIGGMGTKYFGEFTDQHWGGDSTRT